MPCVRPDVDAVVERMVTGGRAAASRSRVAGCLVAITFSGCHARVGVPDLDARPGPFFPPPPETPHMVYVGAITGPSGTMEYPIDVACGPDGTLGVADPNAGAVWTIDLGRRRIAAKRHVGGAPLETPVGVAFDASGELVAVDSTRAIVARWGDAHPGGEIVAQGAPLQRPVAAAPMPDGGLLVVDTGAHALFRMIPGQGLVELRGDDGGGGLNAPTDVVLGPDGAAWVVDALAGAVMRVGDGAVTAVAGKLGVGADGLVRPKGLAFAADGSLHVVDSGMQHVQVYDADGVLEGRYGHPGAEPEALALPGGICFDGAGRAYIADSLNARIQVYAVLPPG